MADIFIGFGSNQGDSHLIFDSATDLLQDKLGEGRFSLRLTTKAISPTPQPDYLNMVGWYQTTLEPLHLLQLLLQTELALNRTRSYKYAPRTLDLDILFYNDVVMVTKNLIIPHPLAHLRTFVLEPMCQINPQFIHPVFNLSVEQLFVKVISMNKK